MGNQGAHQMDTARWLLGVKYPTKVSAMGNHYMFDDDQETPNTLTATFEFDEEGKKKQLVFEVRHWISNHEAGIGESRPGHGSQAVDVRGMPTRGVDNNTIGNIVYGSKGYLIVGEGGYKTYLGKAQEPGPSSSERGGDNFVNFIEAMRSRKRSDLNAEIQEGATSTVLIHLANISYRLGRTLNFDPAGMCCAGDDEANRMFSRDYRAPFVVPANV